MGSITVKRLDPLQVHLPTQVLTIHIAHVCYKKGIFFSGVTNVLIDGIDTVLQSLADQPSGHIIGVGEMPSVMTPG